MASNFPFLIGNSIVSNKTAKGDTKVKYVESHLYLISGDLDDNYHNSSLLTSLHTSYCPLYVDILREKTEGILSIPTGLTTSCSFRFCALSVLSVVLLCVQEEEEEEESCQIQTAFTVSCLCLFWE